MALTSCISMTAAMRTLSAGEDLKRGKRRPFLPRTPISTVLISAVAAASSPLYIVG